MKRMIPVAVVLAVFAACAVPADAKKKPKNQEAPATAAADRPAAAGVVAYVGDVAITEDELDQAAAGQLMRIRMQEYDVRSGVLDSLIQKMVLEKEAQARGVSVPQLLQSEIEDKVPAPTPEEIDRTYEALKPRLGNRTKEEAMPDLERQVRAQKANSVRAAYIQGLADKANVRILLDPPRVQVRYPSDAPALGPEGAPVTIVEYSDYQCGFCRRAHPTVERILKEYDGKVRFVYRDYPLNFHPRATPSAVAARCAGEQGKFWEYHNHLMEQPGDLSDADLDKRAQSLSLDMAAFKSCYESKRYNDVIQAAFMEGQAVGVTGTPAFFVNGRMISGAQPFENFKTVIDDELSRK